MNGRGRCVPLDVNGGMPMRFTKFSIGATLFAGAMLALSAGAAKADDRWDRDYRWDRRHEHWHHGHYAYERYERPVIIHERAPVIVERERPVYMAPPMMYSAPQPSGLNLNFNI